MIYDATLRPPVTGVVATLAVPEPSGPDSANMRFAKDVAMYWTPTVLILFLYGVVQYMARTKGDFEVLATPVNTFARCQAICTPVNRSCV